MSFTVPTKQQRCAAENLPRPLIFAYAYHIVERERAAGGEQNTGNNREFHGGGRTDGKVVEDKRKSWLLGIIGVECQSSH